VRCCGKKKKEKKKKKWKEKEKEKIKTWLKHRMKGKLASFFNLVIMFDSHVAGEKRKRKEKAKILAEISRQH